MAAYLSMTSAGKEFTAADIAAFATELKRRKIPRGQAVEILGHMTAGELAGLTMRVPVKFKRIIVPPAEVTPTKQAIKPAARRKR